MKRWEKDGVVELNDIIIPSTDQLVKGVAIIECVQEIPCNPCVDACPVHAILMKNINAIPFVEYDKCIGCGRCIEVCPGLAIFLVKIAEDNAQVTLPFEFVPPPKMGDIVRIFNREGMYICEGVVKRVKKNSTFIITVELPKEYAMDARHIEVFN